MNICNFEKFMNKVRVVVVLERDLINNDIDLCVVLEMYIRLEKLDVVVNYF